MHFGPLSATLWSTMAPRRNCRGSGLRHQPVPRCSRPPGGRLFPIRRLPVPPEDHAQRAGGTTLSGGLAALKRRLSPSVSSSSSSVTGRSSEGAKAGWPSGGVGVRFGLLR